MKAMPSEHPPFNFDDVEGRPERKIEPEILAIMQKLDCDERHARIILKTSEKIREHERDELNGPHGTETLELKDERLH
jgi:hypothetical protein